MDTKKVLFAYDGSSCANDALEDLKRAGLPSELDLLVVSVAEVWVLETEDQEEEDAMLTKTGEPHVVPVSTHAKEGLERARIFVQHAAGKIRENFPGWKVETRVYPNSPSWGVLHAAKKWNPDLIVMGSHGRSLLGRVFLGSVSQKVLSEALCSVRIARHRDLVEGSPVRLLVGVDGTPDSESAIDQIAARNWPPGSSVVVFSAVSPIGLYVDPALAYDLVQWPEDLEGSAKHWERMEQVTNDAAAKLREAGLLVTTIVREGAPAAMLLEEAETLGADCIFLGARGHRFMERFLLGSVSSAVATRAGCSVEVIRTPKMVAAQTADDTENNPS